MNTDSFALAAYKRKLGEVRTKKGHQQITVAGRPARIFLRQNIAAYLISEGPAGADEIKDVVLTMSGLNPRNIEDRNIADWALVDLQRSQEVLKVAKLGRKWTYAYTGGRYWVDRAALTDLRWENRILWTGGTCNSIVGCSKVSRACKHCYATGFVARNLHDFHKSVAEWRGGKAVWNGKVNYDLAIIHKNAKTWGPRPRLVFFTSLSDPFHEVLSDEQIQAMLDACASYPHILWQWLTKRPVRAAGFDFPDNIWLGATVEADSEIARVDELRAANANVKFLSCEPLTTDDLPSLDLTGIDWLIAGGERGHGAEPMDPAWPRSLRDRCLAARVPFFFKQWGKFGADGLKLGARSETDLDGREWLQFPLVAEAHMKSFAKSAPTKPKRPTPLKEAPVDWQNAFLDTLADGSPDTPTQAEIDAARSSSRSSGAAIRKLGCTGLFGEWWEVVCDLEGYFK